jgi:predicted transcriptional regulator
MFPACVTALSLVEAPAFSRKGIFATAYAANCGGMNLFGDKFGNHAQGVTLRAELVDG